MCQGGVKMKKICLLPLIIFLLNACHTLPQTQGEEVLPPEIAELDFTLLQNPEGMGAEGPWIVFNYRVKNAEWMELELNHQQVQCGPVTESDLRSGMGFQLFNYEEMTFTVIAKNSVGTVSREVIYKK
jgi:hypothetical protein